MSVTVDETVVVPDAADLFAKDFVAEMKKIESLPGPLVSRAKPVVQRASVSKRSPYWQPIDHEC